MSAIVNYSKYINYCEITINCITSKSSKFKYRNVVQFSMAIFCLKFARGDYAGTEKLFGDGDGDGYRDGTRSEVTGVGWKQGLRDAELVDVEMWRCGDVEKETVLLERGGDGNE